MCCVGPEYLAAEAAPSDPSDVCATFSSLLFGHLLDECVGGGHLLSVSLFASFSVLICNLFRHALANPHPPYPSLKLGVEDNGAVMHTEMH